LFYLLLSELKGRVLVYGTADTDCHEVEKGVSMDKK